MTTLSNAAPDAARDPRIDPAIQPLLARLRQLPADFWTLPSPQPQQLLAQLQADATLDLSGVSTSHRNVRHAGHALRLTIMQPAPLHGRPGILLFIPGGAWIAGHFQHHQRLLRDLVNGSGLVGVCIDYTQLPAAFPTQPEECYAALEWLAAHGGELGADSSHITIAGTGVGATLAAALTMLAKDRGGPAIRQQVLLTPATDAGAVTPSWQRYGSGRYLTAALMRHCWEQYAPQAASRSHRYVSPLRATTEQLRALPPALVITAENDPLRDEGQAYAYQLQAAGVETSTFCVSGTIHDFLVFNALHQLPSTIATLNLICQRLRATRPVGSG
jgi:acetyl esterase/lipase